MNEMTKAALSDAETGAAAAGNGANKDFDIIIIGAGISGSVLAAILARHGVNVGVFEAGSHPKFTIGESMILETSEIMRSLAEVYEVPELEYFSAEHFFPYIGTTHGVKRHFSYIHQKPGQAQDPENVVQAVIPQRPYGHEIHIYRQDCDYFYTSVAVKYGAKVHQNTPISDIQVDDDGVSVITKDERTFRADYVIDGGGFRSILADRHNLRRRDMRTHSRGLFTHMTDVPSFHQVSHDTGRFGIPYSLAEGTLHHVFDGGWMWVIPFNNHMESSNPLCSVGLMLDPRKFPDQPDLTPQEEFDDFLAKYPGVGVQIGKGRAVRDWVRAPRIQYSSTAVNGSRFSLMGHAAGFIDPLFSKGLYTTLASVMTLGRLLLKAHKDGDYSQERFAPLERQTLRYVDSNDRLVANSYKSFAHPKLWHQYAVLWILGAYLELVRLTTFRMALKLSTNTSAERLDFPMPDLRLVGGGYAEFDTLAEKVDGIIEALDVTDEAAVQRAISEINGLYNAAKWIPYSHRELANGKKHLPKSKFTYRLFLSEGGILGRPDYKKHFFGDMKLPDVAAFMMKERFAYSRWNIQRRKDREFRLGAAI